MAVEPAFLSLQRPSGTAQVSGTMDPPKEGTKLCGNFPTRRTASSELTENAASPDPQTSTVQRPCEAFDIATAPRSCVHSGTPHHFMQ